MHPDFDYQKTFAALKEQLSGAGCVVHEPGSRGYAQATRLWNGAVERKPALVTACSNTNDVRTALLAARAAGVPVSVRNGGQDWVGRALRDGGLVLDLTPMRQCSVDVEALEATVSGGVTVADLNAAAGRHALAAVIRHLEQIGSAFGPNGQRLLNLKARFDPGNIFSAIPLPGR
jgi:FAD/FMN-containing dehydrogenase